MDTVKLCSGCRKSPASEPHTCPYKMELGQSFDGVLDPGADDKCECCEECEYECGMNI